MVRHPFVLLAIAWLMLVVPAHGVAADSGIAADSGPAATAARHFDPEAATEAYLATLSPKARARSDAYFEGRCWMTLWDTVIGVGLSWLLLGTGLSARMRDVAERRARGPWLQTALYVIPYLLITTVLTLPWAAYGGFYREHQYGMSTQTVAAWLGDQGKDLLLSLILVSVAAIVIYAVIRRTGKSWWLWGAVVAVVLQGVMAAITPDVLEPVFNRFYPLADSPLKASILAMARANGIPATEVYEFDASRQTTKISAHVSGLLGSARISVNDNLMARGSPEEVKSIVGHEMGHYVLHHIGKGLVFYGLINAVAFAFLSWAYGRVQARYGVRWRIGAVTDLAGLPVLVALFSLYFFAMTPIVNTITRTAEAEADMFGLDAAREPDGFAQAALQLSEYRKMRPGPIEEFVLFDHPSGWNRIHRAMAWKAENIAAPDIVAYDAAHPGPGTHR